MIKTVPTDQQARGTLNGSEKIQQKQDESKKDNKMSNFYEESLFEVWKSNYINGKLLIYSAFIEILVFFSLIDQVIQKLQLLK